MDSSLQRLRKMLTQVNAIGLSQVMGATLESRSAVDAEEGPVLDARRVGGSEAEFALETLDVLSSAEELDADQRFVLEAVVMPYHRPVVDIFENQMKTAHLTNKWQHLAQPGLREKIEQSVLSVGRINVPEHPSLPYAGTGFIVGPDLLMTNRHVAMLFAQGMGQRNLDFQPGQVAEVDFLRENGNPKSDSLSVEKVVMIHPHWDMALLKVNGLPVTRRPLQLSTANPEEMGDREVVVVGYPGYDPQPDEEFQRIQNRIFRGVYYVKRLQPGLLKSRSPVSNHTRSVSAITHDCSTLGGNSGSAVFLLPKDANEGMRVVGLHFAGTYLVANYAVPAFDLARDSRVVDSGVSFASQLPADAAYDLHWLTAGQDESSRATNAKRPVGSNQSPPASVPPGSPPVLDSGGGKWTIPLNVTVSLGAPVAVTIAAEAAPAVRVRAAPAVEGLFGRRPRLPTADLPHAFTQPALAGTAFDWRAALSLALASRLSYEDGVAVDRTAGSTWGLGDCRFIAADDTQCFLATTPDVHLISFRGTESVGDWLADLNVVGRNRSYGMVHSGFLNAFQAVEAQLRAALAALPARPLVLTGHSLGGALALVAAAEWDGQLKVASIYTYGQPAAGKGAFEDFMQRFAGRIYRFVNDDDIVPRVPPTYRHVGKLFHFDADGGIQGKMEAPATDVAGVLRVETGGVPMLTEIEFDHVRARLLETRSGLAVARPESLEAPVTEGLLPSVSDHSLDGYIAKIATLGRG